MSIAIFVQLLSNSILLFTATFVYGASNILPTQDKPLRKVFLGMILGGFSLLIMYNAVSFEPGVVLRYAIRIDVRRRWFFPGLTSLTTTIIATIYRIVRGGPGVYAGVLSILSAATVGYIWRKCFYNRNRFPLIARLYLLGFVSALMMITSQLALPAATRWATIGAIILPVMLIYPVVTVFVGVSIHHQIDRLKARDNIRQTRYLLQASLDSPENTSIFALDTKYCYLFYNRYHEMTMLNYDKVQIAEGMNLLDQIEDAKDRAETKANYDRALLGESFTIYRDFVENGKLVHYKNNYGPIKDDNGKIVGLSVIGAEITQQKQTEARLLESEEKNRTLISKMKQGLAVYEIILNDKQQPIDYIIVDINEALEALTGYQRDIIVGKRITQILPASTPTGSNCMARSH
ncbi:MAG: PAS domain-containing protein [Bacillus subtilis]|nr:PAS domain-containing protein [Bacillus subtilis]